MINPMVDEISKDLSAVLSKVDRYLEKTPQQFERTQIHSKVIEAGMWLRMASDMVRIQDLKVEVKPRMKLKHVDGVEFQNETQEKISP